MGKVELFEEAYYGKLPEFIELEELLGKIQAKARKEGIKLCNPNNYPENKKMQDLFSKIFGFKKMIFYWLPSAALNAYTVTIYSMMLFGESKDFIEKRNDRGFYDNSNESVCTVYIYDGMLSERTDLTPRELLAIILHEIGHNFDYSKYHIIDFISDCLNNAGMLPFSYFKDASVSDLNDVKNSYYDETKKKCDAIYNSASKRRKNDKAYEKALNKYYNRGGFRLFCNFLTKSIATGIRLTTCLPLQQMMKINGHKSELFSDSFATAYGYGSDIVSGLAKMSKCPVDLKRTGKGITIMRDLSNCMDEIYYGISEEHGSLQERAKESILKLENDLRTGDYPPELKPELEREINKLKARYYELLTMDPEERNALTIRWRNLNEKLFGGIPNFTKHFKTDKV